LLAALACGPAWAQNLTPNLVGGQYHTSPPTVTNGQLVGIQVDANGVVQVNGTTSGTTTASISQATPGSTNGVNINPTNGTGAGIAETVSAAAESSHVVCSAACNAYDIYVTTGAAAGFLLWVDATSAPSNGAITPKGCVSLAATSSGGPPPSIIPRKFTTGLVLLYSTTGCFNLTLSATAFFSARVSQ
jgi:hypothetical protein